MVFLPCSPGYKCVSRILDYGVGHTQDYAHDAIQTFLQRNNSNNKGNKASEEATSGSFFNLNNSRYDHPVHCMITRDTRKKINSTSWNMGG